jgi:hypothetical protein
MMLQEGSKRHTRMVQIKSLLARYKTGLRYDELADKSGLTAAAVSRACDDLRYEADVVVGIPAPGNGYRVVLGWKKATKLGEANQARHNGTRLLRASDRLKVAADEAADANEAAALRIAARHLAASAADLKELAASF